jgi:hypothetical protein
MEYQNIIIFILIFIALLVVFYIIISNFGVSYSSTNLSYPNNSKELEKQISDLNQELTNIKKKIITQKNPTNNLDLSNLVPPIYTSESKLLNSNTLSNSNTLPNSNQNNEIIIETGELVKNPININTSSNIPNKDISCPSCIKPPPVIFDPIANYDIAKISDPLVDPRGRTSADQIPTPQVAAQFNFPTQGVLDRYHRVGLLIAIGSNKKSDIKSNKFGTPYSEPDSDYDSDYDFDSESGFDSGFSSKSNKFKKNKKKYIIPDSDSTKAYRGIDIKENFDSGYDSDSMENFSNTSSNKITNIYNVYSNQNDNNILELIGKKITDNWYKYFTSITMGNKIIKVVVRNNNRKELYSGDIVFIPEIGKSYRVKIDPMDMIEYNPYMF